ncbi:hypothetical protein COZ22_01730 [bacterium (Candidatus Howlettbacteria) CG_4_10_14_3_um_filter_37_10]|nr:MAG: hypothetical protein COX25_05350 [bacterium (Candidatus Howlettbacteria) CG23_combo_of_CG06-09_8_20_14_all_37_9]PIX99768.1 MAG: hypothetical protein COZ22_01730 [bacterium (Candidatus Howlettbacteria) CG_4_10_14_3_um_filter_37_10]PJB06735.1 MAG: hypothetical protein CO123_01430 [bacterium (Candidatus Howlettbacteria) CG_4_9_14_3_um_filter_37_10]
MSRFFKETIKITLLSLLIFIVIVFLLNLPVIFNQIPRNQKIVMAEDRGDKIIFIDIKSSPILYIPRINVRAPIIFSDNDKDIMKDLERGVSHYPQTALPGKVGNVFISGHSSDYPWRGGSYKEIFINLNNLEVGDLFYIDYESVRYEYKVKGKKIVSPVDMSIMEQRNSYEATLMTCYPPNTNLKRLAVKAELKAEVISK